MHPSEHPSRPAFNPPADGEAVSRKRPPLSVEQILAWADAHQWGKAGACQTRPARELPAAGKALRVRPEELKAGTIRIACNSPNCWTVIEVPVDGLDGQFLGLGCPRCQAGKADRRPDPLTRLAEVLRELSDPKSPVTIEFV